MSGLLEECEKVILEKYLELSWFEYLDCRCTQLVRDEGNLSEKCPSLECGEFLGSLCDLYFARVDIVGTSV